jgi:DNA-binding response OmpR family regulator
MDQVSKKVILVEDDEMLAEIYQTRLELAGFSCKRANNGLAGLELIQKELPDLVLLDLMMPIMSGDDVLKAMRGSEWGKNIKVVILTNISEAEAPDGITELGIEQYIVKANLVNNQLVDTVERILNTPEQPAGT